LRHRDDVVAQLAGFHWMRGVEHGCDEQRVCSAQHGAENDGDDRAPNPPSVLCQTDDDIEDRNEDRSNGEANPGALKLIGKPLGERLRRKVEFVLTHETNVIAEGERHDRRNQEYE
jgi:hypothetical protein